MRQDILRALDRPMTGAEIATRVKVLWPERIYPVLRGMERDGLLVVRVEAGGSERGGRDRYLYSRTNDELRALLRESLSKNGPRAHAGDCAASFGLPASAECTCWMGRARRLLGIKEDAP